jgi:NCS1 family nucleobase:cation symporter-1
MYKYSYGTNWRALVTTIVVVVPLLPGMAHNISPDVVHIGTGLERLFSFNWLYGFVLSIVLYVGSHFAIPDRKTMIPAVVHGTPAVVEGMVVETDGESQSRAFCGKASMDVGKVRDVGL